MEWLHCLPDSADDCAVRSRYAIHARQLELRRGSKPVLAGQKVPCVLSVRNIRLGGRHPNYRIGSRIQACRFLVNAPSLDAALGPRYRLHLARDQHPHVRDLPSGLRRDRRLAAAPRILVLHHQGLHVFALHGPRIL